MIAQWENKCTSLSVLPVALVIVVSVIISFIIIIMHLCYYGLSLLLLLWFNTVIDSKSALCYPFSDSMDMACSPTGLTNGTPSLGGGQIMEDNIGSILETAVQKSPLTYIEKG